jgi:predicted  nucleic acid-binding Zn-ribbon protein
MKAKPQEQARLLELLALDQLNVRERREAAEIKTGASLQQLASAQREASAKVLELRNELDTVSLELKRSEADLELVEQRIARDENHLRAASSAKDAQGITSELDALKRRKSALEDVELELLEKRDELKAKVEAAEVERTKIENELALLNQDAVSRLNKLESGIALRTADRAALASQIDADLVALYEKKASRGVPVGRLLGQECGACHISITAAPFAEVSAVPADEIAACPECQAILIR